jgi:hypothetical protein
LDEPLAGVGGASGERAGASPRRPSSTGSRLLILFQRRQSRQQRIERSWASVHRALSTGLVGNIVTGSHTSTAAAETKFQLRRNSGRRESEMHGIVQTVKILFEILNEICFDFRRPVDESRWRRCEEFKIVITLRSRPEVNLGEQ